VVEGEKKGEKTKVQAFMKVVYGLCVKKKDPCGSQLDYMNFKFI